MGKRKDQNKRKTISSFRRRVLSHHGLYYFVPGIYKYMDLPAIVSLMAPRPFLSINGAKDLGLPIEGVYEVYRVAKRIYLLYGKEDYLKKQIYNCGHKFLPEMWKDTFDWLRSWLKYGY